MVLPIKSIYYSNGFSLTGLFTSIVITISLIFDNFNRSKLKNDDISSIKHAIILFFQVLAISLFTSYFMFIVFGYGGGNLTPCQKTLTKKICNNVFSLKIPHYINIIIMVISFLIVYYIYNKVSLKD